MYCLSRHVGTYRPRTGLQFPMGADLLRVRGREVEDRSSVRITKRDCERELVRELPGFGAKEK
jgi:hypothetical protein